MPPEFAVGDDFQSDVFLQPHDVANRKILDLAQFLFVDRPGFVVQACIDQFLRT